MDFFLSFIGSVILLLALLVFLKFKYSRQKNSGQSGGLRTQKNERGETEFVRCPLCSTPLSRNEDMFSRIYRPMTSPDQRMTVHGCPHCYPRPEPGVRRICPVCKKEVPLDGELIARLFNRTEGKKHVMITGCSVCYGGKQTKN